MAFVCNPLSIITGNVCPFYLRCKKPCLLERNRNTEHRHEHIDSPTDSDHGKKKCDKKIAIVGGGPAGLAAAWILKKHGFHVTIFERESKIGGCLCLIPDSRLDKKHLTNIETEIRNTGIKIKTNKYIKRLSELERVDHIIIAIGTTIPNKLGIPGENLPNVMYALDYLRSPVKNEKVIIIGGGEVAVDCATHNPDSIICYRRTSDKLKTKRIDGINFKFEMVPLRIQLDGVVFSHHESDIFLPCDRVVIAAGQLPDLSILNNQCTQKNNLPKVHVIGDACIGSSTVIDAVANAKALAYKICSDN